MANNYPSLLNRNIATAACPGFDIDVLRHHFEITIQSCDWRPDSSLHRPSAGLCTKAVTVPALDDRTASWENEFRNCRYLD